MICWDWIKHQDGFKVAIWNFINGEARQWWNKRARSYGTWCIRWIIFYREKSNQNGKSSKALQTQSEITFCQIKSRNCVAFRIGIKLKALQIIVIIDKQQRGFFSTLRSFQFSSWIDSTLKGETSERNDLRPSTKSFFAFRGFIL